MTTSGWRSLSPPLSFLTVHNLFYTRDGDDALHTSYAPLEVPPSLFGAHMHVVFVVIVVILWPSSFSEHFTRSLCRVGCAEGVTDGLQSVCARNILKYRSTASASEGAEIARIIKNKVRAQHETAR